MLSRAQQWMTSCRREDLAQKTPFQLYNNYRVCADHFEERMFTNELKERLLPSAVPTLFPYREGPSHLAKGREKKAYDTEDDNTREKEINFIPGMYCHLFGLLQ